MICHWTLYRYFVYGMNYNSVGIARLFYFQISRRNLFKTRIEKKKSISYSTSRGYSRSAACPLDDVFPLRSGNLESIFSLIFFCPHHTDCAQCLPAHLVEALFSTWRPIRFAPMIRRTLQQGHRYQSRSSETSCAASYTTQETSTFVSIKKVKHS